MGQMYYYLKKRRLGLMIKQNRKLVSIFLFFSCVVLLQVKALGVNRERGLKMKSHSSKQIEISGKVTNQNNEPVVGVTIKVKENTLIGTITDENGNYSLKVSDNATLIVSSVGYETKEISVNGRSTIDIVLENTFSKLDQVVVVGYGTQKKENLTGAVSSVSSEELENRPITNIAEGLKGEIPNLNITQSSGQPGADPSFNVRGYTSINGGGPLVLVDGVSMDPNLLNPDDIASVTVLKDAASAAIYGARAAYGVILIETKEGKGGSGPKINISSSISFNSPTSRINFIDTKDRIQYMDQAYQNMSGKDYYTQDVEEAMMNHYNNPEKFPATYAEPGASEFVGVANVDWDDVLHRDSYPLQKHNVSVSGGSEKFKYYTSFGFMKQGGLTKKSVFDEYYIKYNIMNKLNYSLTDWMEIGADILFNSSKKRFPPNDPWFRNDFAENATIHPQHNYSTQAIYDQNGNYFNEGSIQNPYQMLHEGGKQDRKVKDTRITGTLELTPINHVTINADFTYDFQSTKYMSYTRLQPFYNTAGEVTGYYGGSTPNRVIRQNDSKRYHALNIYGNYSNEFGKHRLKVLIGFNQENTIFRNLRGERRKLIVDAIPYMSLATGQQFVSDGKDQFAIRGAFGRINYSFDDRYLLELDGRYDGSSRFPKADRFAFFPSVSVGWRIDKENFFSEIKNTISFLKIRASYGSLGNQNLGGKGYYPYIATMSAQQIDYVLGGERPVTVLSPGLVSPTLTWETVIQKNLGIDFEFLDSRLNGSFDLYQRDTKDMLTRSRTLPAVLGVSEPEENAADLRTKGFGISLGWNDEVGSVSYGIKATLSNYVGTITRFDNPSGLLSDYYVGKKLGTYWGLITKGIFQSDQEAQSIDQSNIVGRTLKAGDLAFEDINGDGKITRGNLTLENPGDLSIIGNNTPQFSYSFRPHVEWEGFRLSLFFQGIGKRDLQLSNLFYLTQYTAEWVGIPKVAMDYWTPDNPDAYFPIPRVGNAGDVTALQSRYLQNAAYLRLKQLSISYTIPQRITQSFDVDRIRVYFTGSNLWTRTKMIKISDPELAGPSSYPIFKSFMFGVNITL